MITIGHASIDENKRASGGAAGDQTGKEVCTRSWYSNNWACVLRCRDRGKAAIMAKACIDACNNPNIGYDQSQRNTLRREAIAVGYNLAAIKNKCECDCSSLMAVCAECAGIKVYSSTNAPTTTSMRAVFNATGMFDVLTGQEYVNSPDKLIVGDILVKPGSHTVMVVSGAGSVAGKEPGYKIGQTYTLMSDMYVRDKANGAKLKYDALTANAKANAKTNSYGEAILKEGTRVTCKGVEEVDGKVWMRIPSGYVCAKGKDKTYIG